MQTLVLLVAIVAVAAVTARLRIEATRNRKAVVARLAEEQVTRGELSPTAELFREVGAPLDRIPTPAGVSAAAGGRAPVEAPVLTHTLTDVFAGIEMPADLAPLGQMTDATATFVTTRSARDVHDGLVAELERLGLTTAWPEPTVAVVTREDRSATVTIHPRPDTARDLDGALCFPTAPPHTCVVRMTLT